MLVKDPEIFKLLDKIEEHYRSNIDNRYVSKAFSTLRVSPEDWSLLGRLTSQTGYDRLQGYHFQPLYQQILAAAVFVHHARAELLPNLRTLVRAGSERERTLTKLAINAFPANLAKFSDLLKELFSKTRTLDRTINKDSQPIYENVPGIDQVGVYLVGH